MPASHPEPLLTPKETAKADTRAAALGRPTLALMEAAATAIVRIARHMGPAKTLILTGPGNNGGDGWAAARLLAQRGWPVAVAEYASPKPGTDAATMKSRYHGPILPFTSAEAARATLVIDAIFGAGLRDDLPPEVAATLAAAPRILAVDVPSGLDGATGQPRGHVRPAEATITFVARKPGHLLLPGRTLCGIVHLADIGMPPEALPTTQTWRNTQALFQIPTLDATSHKYTRGHVTILGGPQMTGAARLAASAARRGGAGLVTIAADGAGDLYRQGDPGLIVDDSPLATLLQDPRRKVWVVGPGLGQAAARTALQTLIAHNRQIVADADALTASTPETLKGATVITPHTGEFTKLFGPPTPDKLTATRTAAQTTGAVTILKGADTIIAAPNGQAAINDNAPPYLATAGAGDILAGLVAAHLSLAMPPWQAACAAVHLHGAAAHAAGPGMLAEDLLLALASIMEEA